MDKKEISTNRQHLAEKICMIRQRSGYTQEQFAKRLGISVSALKKLESGENQISLPVLRKLVDDMGITSDWLLMDKTIDEESLWHRMERFTDNEKSLLTLRLMHYFTETKDTVLTDRENRLREEEKLQQLMDNLGDNGDS